MDPAVEFADSPAQAEIAKLYGDDGFMRAYANKGHPFHTQAVARMEALFKRRYPQTTEDGQ